jgi:hypothetical protein
MTFLLGEPMKTTKEFEEAEKRFWELNKIFEDNMNICKKISDQNIFLWFWNRVFTNKYAIAWMKVQDALAEMTKIRESFHR